MANQGTATVRDEFLASEPLILEQEQKSVYARHHDKLILMALLLILVISSLLRTAIIITKTTLEYDEAISYLAATCNQTRFSNASLIPLPRPAAEWKQYLSLEKPFCFNQIRQGLTQSDVHPPLYFWLLHLWVVAVGVQLWTGPALNILIANFAILALFMLARDVLRNGREALLVVVSYAFNPSIVLISKEARQYDLLILFLILSVWLTHTVIKNQAGWRCSAVLLVLTIAAGCLTHYLFLLIVPPACFVYALWQMAKPRQLWRMLTPLFGGYGLAWLLNPSFWININRQSGRVVTPTWDEFTMRLERVFLAFATFYYVLIPLLFLLLVVFYFTWRHQNKLLDYLRSTNFQGWPVFFFLAWFGGTIVGMYLLFLTPVHTIGSSKYLSMVWPFLAFLPVFALRLVHYRRTVLLYLVIIPLLWVLIFPAQMFLTRLPDPNPQLAEADLILMDNPARGVFFPLLWHVPDQTLVITAFQEELLADPTIWLPYLEDKTLYVNMNDIPNTVEQSESFLALLAAQGYAVKQTPQSLVTLTTVYRVYILSSP